MKITDEMGRALVAKYREFHPGAGWPSLAEAKDLLQASLSALPAGEVKPLKRYEPVSVCSEPDMHERENGDWVRYDDVARIMSAIEPAGVGVETLQASTHVEGE